MRVRMCEQVCVIEAIRSSWESSPLGYISSCHALPLVRSLQFAVDVYEAFLVPGFRDSWALLLSWTPIAGDSSAHCFPALPASAPTESSVSAYGKLRVCLRKLRPSAYGKLRLVSRCVLLLVINSLFPQLNPPVFIVTAAPSEPALRPALTKACGTRGPGPSLFKRAGSSRDMPDLKYRGTSTRNKRFITKRIWEVSLLSPPPPPIRTYSFRKFVLRHLTITLCSILQISLHRIIWVLIQFHLFCYS